MTSGPGSMPGMSDSARICGYSRGVFWIELVEVRHVLDNQVNKQKAAIRSSSGATLGPIVRRPCNVGQQPDLAGADGISLGGSACFPVTS
jgi:hypothetical protein